MTVYTLGPEARERLRNSGSASSLAIQMPTRSRLDTTGSLVTTTVLRAIPEIVRSLPYAWWYLGDPAEAEVFGPNAADLKIECTGLLNPDYFETHNGIYVGTPTFNSIPFLGIPSVFTATVPGPQVRQQAIEQLIETWPIETIAVGFPAPSDYVTFADDAIAPYGAPYDYPGAPAGQLSFGPTDDFAVAGWIQTAVANTAVLTKADSGAWPYRFAVDAGHAQGSRSDGTTTSTVTSTVVVDDGEWHRWQLSKSGASLTLTVDETEVNGSDATAFATVKTLVPVQIGGDAFVGAVSEFTLYRRSVDSAESVRLRRSMLGIPVAL